MNKTPSIQNIKRTILGINDNLIAMNEGNYKNFLAVEKDIERVRKELQRLKKIMKGGQKNGKDKFRRRNKSTRK